jgi:hypothetical protein
VKHRPDIQLDCMQGVGWNFNNAFNGTKQETSIIWV